MEKTETEATDQREATGDGPIEQQPTVETGQTTLQEVKPSELPAEDSGPKESVGDTKEETVIADNVEQVTEAPISLGEPAKEVQDAAIEGDGLDKKESLDPHPKKDENEAETIVQAEAGQEKSELSVEKKEPAIKKNESQATKEGHTELLNTNQTTTEPTKSEISEPSPPDQAQGVETPEGLDDNSKTAVSTDTAPLEVSVTEVKDAALVDSNKFQNQPTPEKKKQQEEVKGPTSEPKAQEKSEQQPALEPLAPKSDQIEPEPKKDAPVIKEKPQEPSAKQEPEPSKPAEETPKKVLATQASTEGSPAKSPAESQPAAKPKTTFMSIEDLTKWEKKMKSLENKLKKAEEEVKELQRVKTECSEKIQGLAAVLQAEREALRDSEVKTKMKFEALEQKNKSLVEMLDQAEISLQQNLSGKGKEIENQREVLKKQLADKASEVDELKERYRKEFLVEKELNRLRTVVHDTQREMERVEASIVQLKRKEIENTKRREAERVDQEAIEHMKLEIARIQQEGSTLDQDLLKLRKEAASHTEETLKLSAQVEELQLKEKVHEVELENETKPIRDEIVQFKKAQVGKDQKLKELERENDEIRKIVTAQEAEIASIASQLRAASQSSIKAGGAVKRTDKSDMKLIEGLLQDKKDLKVEVDKLSRETGRLDVIIKDLDENIELRKRNIQMLLSRYSELEMVDKIAASQILHEDAAPANPELFPRVSNNDLKKLMEKVILHNIYLKQRIPKLESQLETSEIS